MRHSFVSTADRCSVIENTVAYIQSWKKHLKDDPRIIATAAQQAQKAAQWILNNRNQNKEDSDGQAKVLQSNWR